MRNCFLILFAILALGNCYSPNLRNSHGPPEDGLDWIDNSMVPESSSSERRWYAPSRKAHFYEHRKQILIEAHNYNTKVGEDLRLPTDLKPTLYDIQLLPFVEEGNFTTDGSISIDFNCLAATRNITMLANNITIDRTSIKVLY